MFLISRQFCAAHVVILIEVEPDAVFMPPGMGVAIEGTSIRGCTSEAVTTRNKKMSRLK